MIALVGAFNQEKALVRAFTVIVKPQTLRKFVSSSSQNTDGGGEVNNEHYPGMTRAPAHCLLRDVTAKWWKLASLPVNTVLCLYAFTHNSESCIMSVR